MIIKHSKCKVGHWQVSDYFTYLTPEEQDDFLEHEMERNGWHEIIEKSRDHGFIIFEWRVYL